MQQVKQKEDKVTSRFDNHDLVICEDNFLFNNRWFRTEHTPDCSTVDYDKDVLVRSEFIFTNLTSFTRLRRVKITQIRYSQLKQFEQLNLKHLEITHLIADQYASSVFFKNSIRMPALKRLLIGSFSGTAIYFKRAFKFEAYALEAIYLGRSSISF